jgi:hypothetical protein
VIKYIDLEVAWFLISTPRMEQHRDIAAMSVLSLPLKNHDLRSA